MISFVKKFNRQDISEDGRFYVFGDNVARTGLGGQAKECRGLPNTIGIVTKWYPSMEADAFFMDRKIEISLVEKDIDRVISTLHRGNHIVFPVDGIGTGLAELPDRSPIIYRLIKNTFYYLMK